MNQNLIKVMSKDKADELISLGFSYILDSVNDESVYAFFVSEELLEYLNSNFSAKDFFFDNMLRF